MEELNKSLFTADFFNGKLKVYMSPDANSGVRETDPYNIYTDGDGVQDDTGDLYDDKDGLSDETEAACGTDPKAVDTNRDASPRDGNWIVGLVILVTTR